MRNDPMDFGALVREARAGRDDAFETLVRRTEAGVYRALLTLLGDPREAEEASQDVYVAAYRGLAKLRQPESFPAWVIGIAHRIARKRLGRKGMDGLPADLAAPHVDADAVETVSHTLERLSDEHRTALTMRYHEGLNLAEVASRMGRTIQAMKSLMYRAREAFIKEMPR